jgi:Icc-related predicted phosphoesterase
LIYIKGDIHGEYDILDLSIGNFPEQKEMTRNGVVIIAGDFGLIWNQRTNSTESYWLKWLSEKNFTVCFVKGNHENHERLDSDEFPIIKMFGDEVKKIYDNVYMLQTGHIYTINSVKVLAFGGAQSTDKESRINRISWWEEEVPTYKDFYLMQENCKKVDNKVDLIVSHTCPTNIVDKILGLFKDDYYKARISDPTCKMLDWIQENVQFDKWYFGHFHDDIELENKYICSYHHVYSYTKGDSK